jgi:hypothetical protein
MTAFCRGVLHLECLKVVYFVEKLLNSRAFSGSYLVGMVDGEQLHDGTAQRQPRPTVLFLQP